MNVSVNVKVIGTDPWVATVRVVQEGRHTEHRVTVTRSDLERYGAPDAKGLVHRSFVFLLGKEANTSILPEFRITEIETYFPEFRKVIAR